MASTDTLQVPTADVDLFTDAALENPYGLYEQIREQAPAVWLPSVEAWALARYAETRQALRNWQVFSSAHGVMLNQTSNHATAGISTLTCDPPEHDLLRQIVRRPLTAEAVRELTPRLEAEAAELVDRLVEQDGFDAIGDLAQHLPLTVISQLVGIPETGRQRMLDWAAATFNCVGPDNERTRTALPVMMDMTHYGMEEAVPPHLMAGGWAQMVYDAAARGEIPQEMCPMLMSGYLAPSLDTTINGIGNAMLLFGQHPEQWELLQKDRSLIPGAVNEVLRLESPVQCFTRLVTEDHQVGEQDIPAGSRVLVLYGAANRDPRRWDDPTRFDIRRERVAEHLAFGFGPHACVGAALARQEMRVVLEALVRRVKTFTVSEPVQKLNQSLRGLASLQVGITSLHNGRS